MTVLPLLSLNLLFPTFFPPALLSFVLTNYRMMDITRIWMRTASKSCSVWTISRRTWRDWMINCLNLLMVLHPPLSSLLSSPSLSSSYIFFVGSLSLCFSCTTGLLNLPLVADSNPLSHSHHVFPELETLMRADSFQQLPKRGATLRHSQLRVHPDATPAQTPARGEEGDASSTGQQRVCSQFIDIILLPCYPLLASSHLLLFFIFFSFSRHFRSFNAPMQPPPY